jgi:hypothetical protein
MKEELEGFHASNIHSIHDDKLNKEKINDCEGQLEAEDGQDTTQENVVQLFPTPENILEVSNEGLLIRRGAETTTGSSITATEEESRPSLSEDSTTINDSNISNGDAEH